MVLVHMVVEVSSCRPRCLTVLQQFSAVQHGRLCKLLQDPPELSLLLPVVPVQVGEGQDTVESKVAEVSSQIPACHDPPLVFLKSCRFLT